MRTPFWPGAAFAFAAAAVLSTTESSRAEHVHQLAGQALSGQLRLGEVSFPNSGAPSAQEPFLRGVKLLHNFTYAPAAQAFREAQKADPDFVLAYWGEAMTHNETLWARQDADAARAALEKLGPTPTARRARAKNEREARWLDAVETLYGAGSKDDRDVAYADRMDALARDYPDDTEAQVFAALATLGRSHSVRDTAGYMRAAGRLEELFPTHQNHPGVVHYLIHAYDDPVHAPLGLRAARIYDRLAPDNAHALHMTSHIFLALGMWPETEDANVRAIAVLDANLARRNQPPNVCGHGPIWLVYARLQQSKDVSADVDRCRVLAFDAAALAKGVSIIGGTEDGPGGWADMAVRRGIETGRWPDTVTLPPGRYQYARFITAYGRTLASRGNSRLAAAAIGDMRMARAAIAAALPKEAPDERQLLPWIDRAVAQGEAVLLLSRGRRDEALKALVQAALAESALPPVFGPPALLKPSYELLGEELLAAGRREEAAAIFTKALEENPGRRLSLAGLRQATQR
jgi:tetratricopeptide (TPR) repeat protein